MLEVRTVGRPDGPPRLLGATVATLRGVRRVDGSVGDHICAGEGEVLDARGWRVLPAAAEPHAHLDKALTAHRLDAGTGLDLPGAVAAWRAMVPGIDGADIADRALRALRRHLARGTTAVRTHVDVPRSGDPLRGVDALIALRERLRGHLTLQVCLLPGHDIDTGVVTEAVARGIDVVGGCPHLADDPHREVTRLLDVAERAGLPVDLHCDERTDAHLPDAHLDLLDLADQVLARGLQQRVTASHAVRLGALAPDRRDRVIAKLARAGIGVVTLPITNLYLQGRDATHASPRGLTALRPLLEAGVVLAAGGDNLRDPFNPVGRADPFETVSLLVTAGHLRPDEAFAAVTAGARTVMGLPADDPGDVLLVPDVDLVDVHAGDVDARVVVHGGRVVADTRCAGQVDLPSGPAPPDHPQPDHAPPDHSQPDHSRPRHPEVSAP